MENITTVLTWAEQTLRSQGYNLLHETEYVQQTPWSDVIRILTHKGYIYLKITPKSLALEPLIIQRLSIMQYRAPVPKLSALNPALNCFMMQDSGVPLRHTLQKNFNPELLALTLKTYSNLQNTTSTQLDYFLQLGVPDWRLDKLPKLYEQLLQQEDFLSQDGLTSLELASLHALAANFAAKCAQLAHYQIPDTLDHCDLHDNNILLNETTNELTIIDWGESVISQPFFSSLTCLEHAIRDYHLQKAPASTLLLQQSILDSWLEYACQTRLLEALQLARKLWPVHEALAFYRLSNSSDPSKLNANPRNKGRVTRHLKEFISKETA